MIVAHFVALVGSRVLNWPWPRPWSVTFGSGSTVGMRLTLTLGEYTLSFPHAIPITQRADKV
jgi:hypothetical protein